MFENVKKRRKWKKRSFQLIHTQKSKKRGKIVPSYRVIHIIHIKTCEFGELLRGKKRTDVLVSCNEIEKMSKKISKILDF